MSHHLNQLFIPTPVDENREVFNFFNRLKTHLENHFNETFSPSFLQIPLVAV